MDDLSNKTLQELEAIAFSDLTDFCEFGGATLRMKPFASIDKSKLPALREFSQIQGKTSIKMHDKVRALELLGDRLGLFGEFNQAIASLRKYGIFLTQDAEGRWSVTDPDLPQSEII